MNFKERIKQSGRRMLSIILGVLVFICRIIFAFLHSLYRCVIPCPPKAVEGKVILITGAGHGIGRETALRFARLGARLVLWDINKTDNEQTAEDARNVGAGACAYTVDVSNKSAVYAAAQKVQDEVGDVDILINNAGILCGELLLELTDEQIERTFGVNILAHFWIIRSFLPRMLERDSGHIVTIASLAGYFGTHRLVDYSSSKFAAVGLNDALRNELRMLNKTEIHLSVVCPTFVSTGLIHNVAQRILFKMITAEDVAEAIVYGVQRNQRHIFPKAGIQSRLGIMLNAILPYRVNEVLEEAIGITIGSQSKKQL
ncbi:17-beta-hydroxysteroid dehydrogenase 13-like [Anneissia japonica]|uniref:17-beta-hydroxysteroid dehydrogenase 13-like n=1 Tax=Anneissia japonica TaxID=1529436 RepID=UPI0014255DFB|nr:17-beta-hydroxysteroid dehydrogenase 13-like [Anneissia japonica]